MTTDVLKVDQAQRSEGYQPLKLTLTGFRGIRSGMGRDTVTLDLEVLAADAKLVAIAGPNGRGKTTVMDNLHPYMVMPSRSGADGLGAFSYYDHVYLPESEKVLEWSHRGTRYKTHLVFRLNGKKKTEAYLFQQDGEAWVPVKLPDDTQSDGKVDTYERALNAILGSQETFFTSAFSAQGKRPLSAYKNGEIKTLLADLLGLEDVRAQGAKASEVVRLLKSGLGVVRDEQAQAAEEDSRLQRALVSFGDTQAALIIAQAGRQAFATRLEGERASLAQLEAASQAADANEMRRAELMAERRRHVDEHGEAVRRLDDEAAGVKRRATALGTRSSERRKSFDLRRSQLSKQVATYQNAVDQLAQVWHGIRRQGLAARVVELRTVRFAEAQGAADQLEQVRAQSRQLRQGVEAIEREAGQVAIRHSDLTRRFGLAQAVPCAGSDLQGRCHLLSDAREAQAMLPSVDVQLGQCAERKGEAMAQIAALEPVVARLGGAPEKRNQAEQALERATGRLTTLRLLAAKDGEVRQASDLLRTAKEELASLGVDAPAATEDEVAERAEIDAAEQRLGAERARLGVALAESLTRTDGLLQALPPAFDAQRLVSARQAVQQAQQTLTAGEAAETAAVKRHAEASGVQEQLMRSRSQQEARDAHAKHIERSLGVWMLLAKCLSNDGVIALDIDDAGPTFSALSNDLLLACYGQRFTLEVITQTQTAKGELREDFDILVHDGLRGETKSLKLVSGGERVWINECLTRAIALYLAQGSGRHYGTLFCDEADGPLDPEHKRMFMDMKREVLRLGGYAREFFVTQTPELTAMADAIIDLDTLVLEAAA